MKRRDFFTTAAGIGAGALVAGTATSTMAQKKPAEKRLQVYKCNECGTIAEILVPGQAPIVHCGEPMELLEEQVAPAAENKHVPVIEKVANGYKVTVGSSPHPMSPTHWIVWIDLIADGRLYRQFLKPGQAPEAFFCVDARTVSAREYCNLHGLWKDK